MTSLKRPAVTDPGAPIPGPTPTEQMRADAVSYLQRNGYGDLLPVLGLDGPGDVVVATGVLSVACPTCSKPVGSRCRATAGGGPIAKPHVARVAAARQDITEEGDRRE